MINLANNPLLIPTTGTESDNSVCEMLCRTSGIHIKKSITVTGTGSITANVLQFTGAVLILNQWAHLTAVTTLTNATAVYADIYDGTNSALLTKATGCSMSGFTVGSFFYKGYASTEPYVALNADQCRMSETIGNKVGSPFVLNPKNGVTNYIRFNLTTTDNPVNFVMEVHFEYKIMDGGTLAFL